jgi:DNA-directed RNA polymerase specialized sigma24 family protein
MMTQSRVMGLNRICDMTFRGWAHRLPSITRQVKHKRKLRLADRSRPVSDAFVESIDARGLAGNLKGCLTLQAMNDSIAPGAREFQTTRWSVVLAAQHGSEVPRAREAMAELCKDYWYPLYAFVRRRGHAPHDAQDVTQAFFVSLLERNASTADPARGKFRSYLLGALKHFLANEWHRANAQKRGGGRTTIEWDALDPEVRYAMEPTDQADADALYDRRWAMELLDRAMTRLRAEFSAKGDGETFDALKGALTGAEPARDKLAATLGLSDGALKVAVHRLRQRYREVLRAEIADTVNSAAEVDEEMRHLVAILRKA